MYIDLTITFKDEATAKVYRDMALDKPEIFANDFWLPSASFEVVDPEDGCSTDACKEVQLHICDGQLPDAFWWYSWNEDESVTHVYVWYNSDEEVNRGEFSWTQGNPTQLLHTFLPCKRDEDDSVLDDENLLEDEYNLQAYYDSYAEDELLNLDNRSTVDEWIEQFQ